MYFVQLDNIFPYRILVWPWFTCVAKLQPGGARPEAAMTSEKNFKLVYQEKSFRKLAMPNHKLTGFWTGSQDPSPFQASFILSTTYLA
jgi:hypothetical protein